MRLGRGEQGPWLLAATALACMVVFIATLLMWALEVDSRARAAEEGLAREGVKAHVGEIERSIFPQTNWDEAVAHLDNRFDRGWANANLTAYLQQGGEVGRVFVLDGRDRPIYASRGADETAPAEFSRFHAAAPLLAAVRADEAARGAIAPRPLPSPTMLTRAIQHSAFLAVGGEVQLVTATLVQPDFGVHAPSRRAPIVVTTAAVRGEFLELMRRRFQLDDLHIETGAPGRGLGRITFRAVGDEPRLVLAWRPEQPGTDLLRVALGPVVVLLLALTGMGLVMLRGVARNTAHLVAANRAQSEFLANISHEMRTPLNGVVAMAGALGRSPLSPQQAEILELIRMSGQTLEGLLGDMLDLARIETGAIRIEPEPVRLDELARASAAMFALRADEKGLSLALELDEAAATPVLADPLRLKQILANLLSNALKFTERGQVTLRVFQRSGRWVLEVEDTGIGFDAGQAARLFDRFQQADGSITRRFGGAGLGLAICRELCERMHGSIRADGRPGEGARFSVDLPLPSAPPGALASPAARTAAPEVEAAPGRLRILLADDHPTNRKVVEVLLAGAEVELTSVENGAEACEAFAASAYDVVLMDMQMPVMDGVTAVRRIRAIEAGGGRSRSFVVMLTANALPEHRDSALAAGADLHLAKPITPERLFAALAQAEPPPRDAAAA